MNFLFQRNNKLNQFSMSAVTVFVDSCHSNKLFSLSEIEVHFSKNNFYPTYPNSLNLSR